MHAAAARTVVEPFDELTLRRAQRGDERAWRDLIERFQQPVYSLIWRLLAGRAKHRAEDLAQETFVRVMKALPRFEPGGPASLSTWILTIATRLALNELRKPESAELEREPIGRERADGDAERRRLARRSPRASRRCPMRSARCSCSASTTTSTTQRLPTCSSSMSARSSRVCRARGWRCAST